MLLLLWQPVCTSMCADADADADAGGLVWCADMRHADDDALQHGCMPIWQLPAAAKHHSNQHGSFKFKVYLKPHAAVRRDLGELQAGVAVACAGSAWLCCVERLA